MKRSKHSLKPSDKEGILRVISDHLILHHPEIASAYCFGSFRDEAFSDIDLGFLLFKAVEEPLTYEMNMEEELEKLISYPLDIRVINRAPLSFCQAVVRGKLIVDRDPDLRADFENRVLKRYYDFAPFRRRYLAEVLNAPV